MADQDGVKDGKDGKPKPDPETAWHGRDRFAPNDPDGEADSAAKPDAPAVPRAR